MLAERYNGGVIATKVYCYVGGGWYFPGQTVQNLQDEMRRHLDAGYTMVKMKVGGLEARRGRPPGGGREIDPARGHTARRRRQLEIGRHEALAYAEALAPFRLRWFEEPCDPLDFALLAEIASEYAPPLSTGENLFSTQDVENSSASAACDPTATT